MFITNENKLHILLYFGVEAIPIFGGVCILGLDTF